MGDLFSGVEQWEFDFRGAKQKLPVFYFDNTLVSAVFTAATARVRALLPHPALRPVETLPGRAVVAVTGFEYRRTDIDPYNELLIAFLVTHGRRSIPGVDFAVQVAVRRYTAYVWQLPVTTERARVGGVEIYGYPKFLADIAFERGAGAITCRLGVGGTEILALHGKQPPTRPGRRMRYRSYSVKDGALLVTNVVIDPLECAESRGGAGARLVIGRGHPISDQLRELGLSEKPILYQYAPRTQAILFAPRNLLDT
jgi:hypothetical protein